MNGSSESCRVGPGFSLAVLLAWVGVCAVLFTVVSWPTAGVPRWPWVTGLVSTIKAMSYAAGLVGLALCGGWWWHGRKTPQQPGHWLLCLVGALGIVFVATRLATLALWGVQLELSIGSDEIRGLVSTFSNIGKLTVLIAGLVFVRLEWPWRVVPLLMVVQVAAMSVWAYAYDFSVPNPWDQYLGGIYRAAWCGTLLMLVVFALRDVLKRTPRDGMHWAGVAAWGMLYVPELAVGWVLWLTT